MALGQRLFVPLIAVGATDRLLTVVVIIVLVVQQGGVKAVSATVIRLGEAAPNVIAPLP